MTWCTLSCWRSRMVARMANSRRAAANLLLATVAFALCFTAWSLIAPFAKTFKHELGLELHAKRSC